MTLAGCSSNSVQLDSDLTAVDERAALVSKNAQTKQMSPLFSIDHSRFAGQVDTELAASRVDFYSDNELNSQLLQQNILTGLDLPFRVLSYAKQDEIKTVYTDSRFLQKRYDLNDTAALQHFESEITDLVEGIPNAQPVNTDLLTHNYGIIEIESEYDFETTISNLKRDILDEGDTRWFLTWDYQEKAQQLDVTLPNATLLVFGAPAPGAAAMSEFPSIGLDAFGQKVLVYQQGEKVMVAYNDIVDIANLHYQDTTFSHRVINFRLGKTLSNAIEK